MSNFFEMGSSHIQPAWESNNNNKKKWRRGGEKALLLPFLSAGADRPGSGGEGGAWAGGAGPGGGGGRSSLRGWDVRGAAGAAEPPGGPRRGGGCGRGGRGGRRGRRLRGYLCGPRPGSDPRAGSWGAQSFLPRDSPLPFKESFEWSVRGSALAAVPSASTPWGSRHLFDSWQEASGPAVRGR